LFLAAVFAGSSAFLAAATPYLLGASILFICYGVLSSPASEKMPAPAQCNRLSTVVVSRGVRGYLHLPSATTGNRLGQFADPLMPSTGNIF
jgi:hypothetical protein